MEAVQAVVVVVIHHEIIHQETRIINKKEDGETTIITTITYPITITTKEEWEDPIQTTRIITKTIILQIAINLIIIRNPRIMHRIISRCNSVNFIKPTNAQIRSAKDFMDLQKAI